MVNTDQYVPINQSVGQAVSLGPVPAHQLIPLGLSFCGSIFFLYLYFRVSLYVCLLLWGWTAATWWILTGRKRYRYTNRWTRSPNWTRGFIAVAPLLAEEWV